MEAQIRNASVPLNVSLRVRFKADEAEKFFDFIFNDYSKDPTQPNQVTSAPEPAAAPVPVPVVEDRSSGATSATSAREILTELDARSGELADKIEKGAPMGEYWVPALRTKDLALSLINDHLNEIPARNRAAAENASGRLLRAAFAIDNFADLGDRQRLLAAHESFVSAVNDLKAAYASIR